MTMSSQYVFAFLKLFCCFTVITICSTIIGQSGLLVFKKKKKKKEFPFLTAKTINRGIQITKSLLYGTKRVNPDETIKQIYVRKGGIAKLKKDFYRFKPTEIKRFESSNGVSFFLSFFFFFFFFFLFEIMVLFVLRKLILQTRMRCHPVGLDVWFLVGPFVYFHTSCVQTANALERLCGQARLSFHWSP